jgi:hypothetical protein
MFFWKKKSNKNICQNQSGFWLKVTLVERGPLATKGLVKLDPLTIEVASVQVASIVSTL